MPISLTLRDIPNELYERLRASARIHRRSLNREAIACLELALAPRLVAVSERLARARALRAALPKVEFRAKGIDACKREGRK